MKVWQNLKSLFMEENGISSVEYALLLALAGAAIAVGAGLLGAAVGNKMNEAGNQVNKL
jgi:pilus assembly protein Flp/PilA